MKKTINFYEFRNEFMEVRPGNFSYEGLLALYNYIIELEAETGEEIEFDIIALCCDYTEYENIKEFNTDYGKDYRTIDEIQETVVIPVDDEKFIIQNY